MDNILIEIPESENANDFIVFLLGEIKQFFIENLDPKQLNRFDEYLTKKKNLLRYNQKYKKQKPISARDILIGSIESISYNKTNRGIYRIFINPNALIPNTQTHFETLLNLIDKGNMEISPYSIWSDTVLHFCQIIPQLYEQYTEEKRNVYQIIR